MTDYLYREFPDRCVSILNGGFKANQLPVIFAIRSLPVEPLPQIDLPLTEKDSQL